MYSEETGWMQHTVMLNLITVVKMLKVIHS